MQKNDIVYIFDVMYKVIHVDTEYIMLQYDNYVAHWKTDDIRIKLLSFTPYVAKQTNEGMLLVGYTNQRNTSHQIQIK